MKNGPCLNHLLFIDDFKMFAKSDHEMKNLVDTVKMSKYVRMEFATSKYAVITLKREKRVN